MKNQLKIIKRLAPFCLVIILSTGFTDFFATTFYRAKCETHGFISNWHYNRGNADIAKKHHESRWSTRGKLDPNHKVSIVSKTNEKSKLDEIAIKNIDTQEINLTTDFMMDDELPQDKKEYFEFMNVETWYDLKCPEGHICCENCTADGDPARCSKTKFANCRECGHKSSSHYAVKAN